MSKGSTPRPMQVSQDEFASAWDNIFRKRKIRIDIVDKENTFRTNEKLEGNEALEKLHQASN